MVCAIGIGVWFFWEGSQEVAINELVWQEKIAPPQQVLEKNIENDNPTPIEGNIENTLIADKFIQLDVPFILQAPFANWSDFVFENACEEASIAMAMNWIAGEGSVSPEKAKKQILEIVKFEDKEFGYNTDTDIFDMQIIFQKYFKYQNIETQKNISIQDIKTELQKGNVVIVPAFGRALKNPNYTGLGPIVHMLIIIGYDPKTKEFITNDPGTRKGAGYRYAENVLFSAIWLYPSGPDTPTVPTGALKKGMLIVRK